MRHASLVTTAALLLTAGAALAQQTPQTAQAPQTPPASAAATPGGAGSDYTGTVDVGGQFNGTTGDKALFERLRDDRSGIFSNIAVSRRTDAFWFDASARHIGYRDQRYTVSYLRPKLNFDVNFQGQPLNYSYVTRTPYDGRGTDTLTLDDNAQRAVQGPTFAPNDGLAVGVPCAPGAPPAACGTPAQVAQAKATPSIYNAVAQQFDLRQTRNTAEFDATYNVTRDIDIDARFRTSSRDGEQPWGASFAFNNAIELPKPLDDRTNAITLGTGWGRERGSFRLAYDGSWYNNRFHSLTWDNPLFINDYNNGLTPPNGPYDPNGYSNGNGPAMGREALAPDNSMHVLSATGLYRFWRRTSLNGVAQFTTQNQNDALIPWTINSLINSPVVIAAFPHLAQVPRATAEAKAVGVNTMVSFTTRPMNRFSFNARYRFNRRDVQTPVFDATEYVRFDAVPEENEEGFSPQYDVSRHIFDATLSYTPAALGTVRLGYGHEATTRNGRGFADVDENSVRLTWDTYSSQFVTLRATFEGARRRGSGFVEAESGQNDIGVPTTPGGGIGSVDAATGANPATVTGPGGTQPTLRYYDEADRDRVRGSFVVTVMPMDTVDLFAQFTGTHDKYLADNTFPVDRPGELFGLQNASVRSWNFGVNYNPDDRVSAGASYGRDFVSSFQRSRNANPPPDPTWTDPSRDWTLDNDDTMNVVNLYVDLLRLARNTDVRVAYDFHDSDSAYVHGGPRIAGLQALGQFIPLPNVTDTWQRVSADVQHYFTRKVGVGIGYYFEKLDIVDFATVDTNGPVGLNPATGTPRIEWLGGLITGYGFRPYTGNTGYVRLLYRF